MLAASVALLVGLLLTTLLAKAPRTAATNGRTLETGAVLQQGGMACQKGESIPRNVSAVGVLTSTAKLPAGPLEVTVRDRRGRRLGTGRSRTGFVDAPVVVQVGRAVGGARDATVCVRNVGPVQVAVLGARPDAPGGTAATLTGTRSTDFSAQLRLEWYRPGRETWLAVLPVIAERASLFKASVIDTWTVYAALALLGLLGAAAVALVSKESERSGGGRGSASAPHADGSAAPGGRARPSRRPSGALVACVLLAALNASVWAVVTPSFQTPDELVHAQYVQYVAETGELPRPVTPFFRTTSDLGFAAEAVPFSTTGQPSWSPAGDAAFRRRARGFGHTPEEASVAYVANNPPLYYALATLPYHAASSATFFDRLLLMRLFSALLAGATVGFVFAFLRELLPSSPWAWTVGALAVGFQPVFGFVGGGVSNDNLLWVISAALFYGLARAFRRGLTPRRGALIGFAAIAGLLTKGVMIGLLPGAAAGIAACVLLAGRERRRTALAGGALALLVFVGLQVGWGRLDDALFDRPSVAGATGLNGGNFNTFEALRGQLTYFWESFLPRLPFMNDYFNRYPFVGWNAYFQGFVGRFGWFEYGFPMWANWLGLGVVASLAALAVATLVRSREVLRRRWLEASTYLACIVGLLGLVAFAAYRYRTITGQPFEQTRYLFPLLALYGGFVALAARSVGRYGPALGAGLVVLAFGHDVFAVLLTLERYYA